MVDYALPDEYPYADYPDTARPLRAADYNAALESLADLGAAGGRVATLEAGDTALSARLDRVQRVAAVSHLTLDPAADRAVMQAPPTLTLVGPTTTPPYAQFLPYDTAQVRLLGGVFTLVTVSSQNYQSNIVNAPGNATQQPAAAEFTLYGDRFAAKFGNRSAGNSGLRIIVDGQPASATKTATEIGSTGGAAFWVQVVFSSVGLRTIKIEYDQAQFGGVSHETGAVIAPVQFRRPRCAVLGDSWVGGANAVAANELLAHRIGQAFGWDIARMGIGGTGYVNVGSGFQAYGGATRVASLASYAPEWAIIIGSINDDATSSTTVGAAAAALYDSIAEQSPQTKLIVVGPQQMLVAAPAGRLANRDAIRDAAEAAPNALCFLDPIADEWIGLGETALIHSDATHPTEAGHERWATRLTQAIMAAG